MAEVIRRDDVRWFPMYVSYHRELSVKQALDEKQIVNYIPMRVIFERKDKKVVKRQEPAIHNLIFVYSTMNVISGLKMFDAACAPLQYMISRARNSETPSTIITVDEASMKQFMRAMEVEDADDRRKFLAYEEELFGKEGRKVRFVNGDFAGIEGTIKRINKNRSLIITLKHVGALVITIDHAADIEFLD